jgi:hypothetical protein
MPGVLGKYVCVRVVHLGEARPRKENVISKLMAHYQQLPGSGSAWTLAMCEARLGVRISPGKILTSEWATSRDSSWRKFVASKAREAYDVRESEGQIGNSG